MTDNNLITAMNQGTPRQTVTITTEIDAFDVKQGAIPYTVPALRKEGRIFAGGNVVLKKRLDALTSQDQAKINVWGNNYFNLADLCLIFEDQVKLQADSPLLTGIRGVVETQDDLFAAIDAEYAARAVKDMKPFKVSGSETVVYGLGDNQRSESAQNVVLLRYVAPNYVELNADQFNSVNVETLRRKDLIIDRDMRQDEIVKEDQVIHKAFSIYPVEMVVPFVQKTFEYNKRTYNYDTNMGLYLTSPPQDHAEMRVLCVDRLCGRSWLSGYYYFGDGGNRVVGVASGYAAGAAKK